MSYTIKQTSEIIGLSIDTLRYYERLGLLDPVTRAANGHRRFSDRDLTRLDFLKRLKATGMSLDEMLYYVELYRAGDGTLTERRQVLEAHRAVVEAQIASLQETVALLDRKIATYRQQEGEQSAAD